MQILQQGNKKSIKINWQQWERVAKSQHLRAKLIVQLWSEEQDSNSEAPNEIIIVMHVIPMKIRKCWEKYLLEFNEMN